MIGKGIITLSEGEIFVTPNNEIDPTYEREIIERTKRFRIEAGFNDIREFARLMKIKPEYWIDYEDYTPIPQYLIPDFCRITKIHPWTLLSNKPMPKFK